MNWSFAVLLESWIDRYSIIAESQRLVTAHRLSKNSTPTESRGDGSQNCLHDMRIVGDAQLVWDR